MSLGLDDILDVLGEAQEAGVIDLQSYVSLLTRFNKALRTQKAALTAAGNVPPADLRPAGSESIVTYAPPDFREKTKPRKAEGIGIEVKPYPPDEGGGEPP